MYLSRSKPLSSTRPKPSLVKSKSKKKKKRKRIIEESDNQSDNEEEEKLKSDVATHKETPPPQQETASNVEVPKEEEQAPLNETSETASIENKNEGETLNETTTAEIMPPVDGSEGQTVVEHVEKPKEEEEITPAPQEVPKKKKVVMIHTIMRSLLFGIHKQ